MSYSRWGQSVFYTYWSASSPPEKENQILVVDADYSHEFTYKELKTDLHGCLDRVQGYKFSELHSLRGYMLAFIQDVDQDERWRS